MVIEKVLLLKRMELKLFFILKSLMRRLTSHVKHRAVIDRRIYMWLDV